jgi:hypothetical protein
VVEWKRIYGAEGAYFDPSPHIPLQQTTAKIVWGDASPLSWCTILSLHALGRGRGHLFSKGGVGILQVGPSLSRVTTLAVLLAALGNLGGLPS